MPLARLIPALAAGFLAVAAAGSTPTAGAGAQASLIGTFSIAPGSCAGGVEGSYFRMILPTGGPGGPYVTNGDSPCGDKTYTLLQPGTDGGLVTGTYQNAPSPGFDGSGNSLADRITHPTAFFGVDFSTSTDPVDLQTGIPVPSPLLATDGSGGLTGDLSSFGATWNKQAFNQGSPKPDGSRPGNTAGPTGTFDAATDAFTLSWTSQIVGGPFNNFTGEWHLAGTFIPAGGEASPPPTTGPADGAPGGGANPGGDTGSSSGAGAPAEATTVPPSSDTTSPATAAPGEALRTAPQPAATPRTVEINENGGRPSIPAPAVGAAVLAIATSGGLLIWYRRRTRPA